VKLCDAGGEVAEPVKDTACMQEEGRAACASGVRSEPGVELVQDGEDEYCTDHGYKAANE